MNGIGLSGERHGILWAQRNLVAAVVAAIFVFITMLAMASPARAANIVVTSNADSGAGTLRAAVATANGNNQADTITFNLPAGSRTITLLSEIEFTEATNTTIDGGSLVTVSGGNATRVFRVSGYESGGYTLATSLSINRLTVSNGNAAEFASGGGIDSDVGTLSVTNSTFSNNSASSGGGIYNSSGRLSVTNSTFSNNSAEFTGGGIVTYGAGSHAGTGTLNITDSTISGNTAVFGAGGIDNSRGTLSVTDSTISNNSVTHQGDTRYGGGGIRSAGSSTIENSTISGNSAYVGGGILNGDGTTNIRSTTITSNTAAANQGAGVASYGDNRTFTVVGNSIIAANSTTDVDLFSGSVNSFTSEGYNVIGDGNATGDFNTTGDQRGVTDPKLGSLQNNGGPTMTHALLTGSPAINNGSTTLATDQRGVSRPQGAADDVGAFELEIVNTAPVASGQSVTTNEDTAKAITLTGSDADGNNLTYSVVSGPTHGTLSGTDANQTYTPNANYNGADSFTFKANDGTADSNTATVSITVTAVDDNPVAVNDNKTVAEDDPATTINVLSNDTDVDGGTKSIQSVTQPAHGTVAITNNGADLTYNPNADYCNGGSPTDDFNYTLNGGSTAKVAVTVTCVDDVPKADAQSVTTNEDTAKAITLTGSDADGDSLAYSIDSAPSHGTLSGTDANQTYTPNANYNGPDSFDYSVSDGKGGTDTATVNVTVAAVNDKPVANNQSVTTAEDNSKDVTLSASDVEGSSLTYTIVDGPTHGTLSGTGATRNYTPAEDYNGPDSFTFKANDGTDDSNVATVSITVNAVNDAPVGTDDAYTTDEDTDLTVSAANGLLKNDTDIEHDTLHVADADANTPGINPVSGPSHGQLTLNADGSFTYKPNTDYNGSDSFDYRVCDNGSPQKCSVETAKVNITINPINDAPVAVDDSLTTDEDTAKLITLGANDVDGDALTYSIVDAPAHGTLSGTGANRTYTPAANYNGSDSFTFKANDGTVDSNAATVSITVNAVNDAPTVTLASGGSCSTSTTSVSGTMNLSLADVDSSVGPLTLSATSSNKTLVPVATIKFGGSGANRTVSITPAAKKSGSATIEFFDSAAPPGTAPLAKIQVIVGTDRKETIGGTIGADMIFGQNGDDTINAGDGNDLVCGGNAGGVISGGAGDDTLDGGNGNDVLRGDAGTDIVRGSAGNDTLTGGSEADSFDGGSGTDVATDYNAAEGDARTNIP